MTVPFTGGCECGQVRYEVTGEPAMMANCHCTHCQKASGGAGATVVAVPRDSFKLLQGETKSYEYTGDSGKQLQRHFCPECGSRLFTDVGVLPDLWIVTAGSMDDASWITPDMHIYMSSALPWHHVPADAPQFPKMPG